MKCKFQPWLLGNLSRLGVPLRYTQRIHNMFASYYCFRAFVKELKRGRNCPKTWYIASNGKDGWFRGRNKWEPRKTIPRRWYHKYYGGTVWFVVYGINSLCGVKMVKVAYMDSMYQLPKSVPKKRRKRIIKIRPRIGIYCERLKEEEYNGISGKRIYRDEGDGRDVKSKGKRRKGGK